MSTRAGLPQISSMYDLAAVLRSHSAVDLMEIVPRGRLGGRVVTASDIFTATTTATAVLWSLERTYIRHAMADALKL